MKSLFEKIIVSVAGVLAVFGVSATNVAASVSNVSSKSALYLEHGKYIESDYDSLSWHTSHGSHSSHQSHASHRSSY